MSVDMALVDALTMRCRGCGQPLGACSWGGITRARRKLWRAERVAVLKRCLRTVYP